MRNTAKPARASAALPMRSGASGGSAPGARVKVTRLLTRYVPLWEPTAPPTVAHLPPPVTSSGAPGRNVPEPVIVIVEPSLALADSCPPGVTVASGVRMSQRNLLPSSSANASAGPLKAPSIPMAPAPLRTCRRLIRRSFTTSSSSNDLASSTSSNCWSQGHHALVWARRHVSSPAAYSAVKLRVQSTSCRVIGITPHADCIVI